MMSSPVPEKPDAGMSSSPAVLKTAAFAFWRCSPLSDRPCCVLDIGRPMPRFLECFPTKRNLDEYDQLDGIPASKRPVCIFCDVSVDKGFKVVLQVSRALSSAGQALTKGQDHQLIAFHDRSPRAKTHLLIIPRSHVGASCSTERSACRDPSA